jgi:hypothetical protein
VADHPCQTTTTTDIARDRQRTAPTADQMVAGRVREIRAYRAVPHLHLPPRAAKLSSKSSPRT